MKAPFSASGEMRSTAEGYWSVGRHLLDASALLVWGIVLCYFVFSGRLAAYLHPAFHPYVALAGGLLVLLGCGLIFFRKSAACSCMEPGCPIDVNRPWARSLMSWIVVVFPLLITTQVSPSQFGETAVLNRGLVDSATQLPTSRSVFGAEPGGRLFPSPATGTPYAGDPSMNAESYLARNSEGRIRAETIDLLFAAEDPILRPDFADQEIEIIGQYLPLRGENPPPDQFHLVRIFIMCCAADARPIGITVRGVPPPHLTSMEWIKVKGRATFPKVKARIVAVVEAESIEPIPAPSQPFIF